MAQSSDLVARPPLPEPSARPACVGATVPFQVEGLVSWPDGRPAEGVLVVFQSGEERVLDVRTGADGTYRFEASQAGTVSVADAPSTRAEACVRPPLEAGPAREAFTVGRVCPVRVRTAGPGGAPVADAEVYWEVRQGGTTFRGQGAGVTDGRGELALGNLPCGEASLRVVKAGLAQRQGDSGVPGAMRAPCRAGDADAVRTCFRSDPRPEPPTVAVELVEGVPVRGRVTDTAGSPVHGARAVLLLLGETVTDAQGRWELWVPPGALDEQRFVTVRSEQHLDVTVPVSAPTAEGWSGEVALVPTRRVAARCAGFSGDRCDSVYVSCALEGGTAVHECLERDPGICECPTDPTRPTILAGAGLSVYVEPGATSAWLDFRPWTGEVTGRVDGAGCVVRLERPAGFRGPGASPPESRAVPCADDGTFRVEHVAPGPWDVSVSPRATLLVGGAAPLRRVEVGAGVVDLGPIGTEAVAGG